MRREASHNKGLSSPKSQQCQCWQTLRYGYFSSSPWSGHWGQNEFGLSLMATLSDWEILSWLCDNGCPGLWWCQPQCITVVYLALPYLYECLIGVSSWRGASCLWGWLCLWQCFKISSPLLLWICFSRGRFQHVTFKVFTQRCKVNKINSSNTEREKEATNHS